jgi:hypothetical protein
MLHVQHKLLVSPSVQDGTECHCFSVSERPVLHPDTGTMPSIRP